MMRRVYNGFTLAELLIALVILGLIATFTIPKVLQNQQSNSYKAGAKEVAGMLTAAYDMYRYEHGTSATADFGDMTPYINYVRFANGGSVDGTPGNVPLTCGSDATKTFPCIVLHNGVVLRYRNLGDSFGSTASTAAIYFEVDPDGMDVNDPVDGKSLVFFLYIDGRLVDGANKLPNTYSETGAFGAVTNPSWFDWN